ncbi:MAG: immunoglobulin domain-containing protein [Verrucomicrobia bacterium]|nr:immunoglobulin domain-containing protein [Verrucomicrobiota bacterium]
MIKSVLVAGCVLFLIQSTQAATLPFYESFPTTYAEGERLGGATSGANWDTGNGTGTGSATNTINAALSYSGLATSSSSRGILLTGTPSSNRDRGVTFSPAQPIGAASPTLYVSFLLNVQTPSSATRGLAYFRNSTSSGTPSAGIYINSSSQLQLVKSGTTPAADTSPALNPGTHLVVMRYKWTSATSSDEEVSLWLNPISLGADESGVPEPTISTTDGSDVSTLNAFFISQKTDASGTFWMDEVRIATTWSGVTPIGEVTLPSQPHITQAVVTAGEIILSGTNGVPGGSFLVLSSHDVNLPFAEWSVVATNFFDENGDFAFTNSVSPSDAKKFYIVSVEGAPPSTPVAPTILTQPLSQTVLTGQNATFSVGASGTAPLSYRWYFNTNTLLASSGNSLVITNAQASNAGNYFVIVTNDVGSATSAVATLTVTPPPVGGAPSGFAALNGNTTGGAGGPIVTVTNFAQFDDYARVRPGPYIIQVQGTINLGTSNARVTSNKTIVGLGTNATLFGNLKAFGVTNIIVQNITFTNPNKVGDGDGFTLDNARNMWIDHCTFVDCGDGSMDITHGSDWVTVSWCKFYYTFNSGHNFVNLVGHSDSNSSEDSGRLRVTFHHNWWGELCIERMPRVRFGRIHSYNNYFNSPGNNYCFRAARDSEVLVENNYFENVKNAWELYRTTGVDGKVYATNNIHINPSWSTTDPKSIQIPGTDILGSVLNPPPYGYAPDDASSVPTLVIDGAGVGKGPFAP